MKWILLVSSPLILAMGAQARVGQASTDEEQFQRHLATLKSRIAELENRIPILMDKIDGLESVVEGNDVIIKEFEDRRRLEADCSLTESTDNDMNTVCTLSSRLEVVGDTTISGKFSVTNSSSTSLGGSVTLNAPSVIMDGAVDAAADASMEEYLYVQGTTTLRESLDMTGDLYVLGDTTVRNDVDIEGDDNKFTIEGKLIVEDDTEVDGESTFEGDFTHEEESSRSSYDDPEFTVVGESEINAETVFEDNVVFEAELEVDELDVTDGTLLGVPP
jgi:hypothetical protein